MSTHPIELVARHEAGHAVAAVVLGLQVTSASIVRHGESLGRVLVNQRAVESRTAALFALAGMAAAGTTEDCISGSRRDLEVVGRLTTDLTEAFGWLAEAVELLADHRPAVERVTTALLEQLELDGDAVAELVAGEVAS